MYMYMYYIICMQRHINYLYKQVPYFSFKRCWTRSLLDIQWYTWFWYVLMPVSRGVC